MMINSTIDNVSFNRTHDHSKWAVSASKTNLNWLCIGDINRMVNNEYTYWNIKNLIKICLVETSGSARRRHCLYKR